MFRCVPCCFDGAFAGFSEQGFELCEDLLDWVEIGAVRREEEQLCTGCADSPTCGLSLVAAEIVQDHDVAWCEGGDEELLDPGGEELAVDRPIDHAWRIDPVMTQGGDE